MWRDQGPVVPNSTGKNSQGGGGTEGCREPAGTAEQGPEDSKGLEGPRETPGSVMGKPHQCSRFPTDEPPRGGGRVRVRRPGARAGLTSPARTPSSRVQE